MFMGESGVGKSTLFNILMGFLHEYEGEVKINDVEHRLFNLTALRRQIGIAFQSANVISVGLDDNIQLGEDLPKLADIIEITNLSAVKSSKTEADLHGQALSGGEKSRIGLAQTLIRSPEVILIDETFSSLDEAMEEEILGKLFEKYPSKTVICISHRAASKKYFDKVVQFG